MSHRSVRLEVLQALAEFDRSCLAFSRGMARIRLPADLTLHRIIQELGEPKPARRADATRSEIEWHPSAPSGHDDSSTSLQSLPKKRSAG